MNEPRHADLGSTDWPFLVGRRVTVSNKERPVAAFPNGTFQRRTPSSRANLARSNSSHQQERSAVFSLFAASQCRFSKSFPQHETNGQAIFSTSPTLRLQPSDTASTIQSNDTIPSATKAKPGNDEGTTGTPRGGATLPNPLDRLDLETLFDQMQAIHHDTGNPTVVNLESSGASENQSPLKNTRTSQISHGAGPKSVHETISTTISTQSDDGILNRVEAPWFRTGASDEESDQEGEEMPFDVPKYPGWDNFNFTDQPLPVPDRVDQPLPVSGHPSPMRPLSSQCEPRFNGTMEPKPTQHGDISSHFSWNDPSMGGFNVASSSQVESHNSPKASAPRPNFDPEYFSTVPSTTLRALEVLPMHKVYRSGVMFCFVFASAANLIAALL